MKLNKEKFLVKRLTKRDTDIFQKLILLFKDVFEMEKFKEAEIVYLEKLLKEPKVIVFVVLYESEVVGGLTAYELAAYHAEGSEIFIYDIAVKREFQGHGAGKKLIGSVKEYCRENGIREFFVEAHQEDIDAVNFYHSTGGKAERVVQFNYEVDAQP